MPKITPPADPLHTRAVALLAALDELFEPAWAMEVGSRFYVYSLILPAAHGGIRAATDAGRPFVFHRAIEAKHINAEPFRTALLFADEVCERYGRWVLLKPDEAQP